MNRTLWVVTGWDVVWYGIGLFLASFITAFVKQMRRDLIKADATFDRVVQTALENFPNSYIHISRGPLFFIDNIHARVMTTTDLFEPIEYREYRHKGAS